MWHRFAIGEQYRARQEAALDMLSSLVGGAFVNSMVDSPSVIRAAPPVQLWDLRGHFLCKRRGGFVS